MRIALVNWAKIWHGASRGGGINAYTQSLALSLLQRGHEVVSISSGTNPRLKHGETSGHTRSSDSGTDDSEACHVRRHADWLGVRVFEIVHSPVRAPSTYQFDRPQAEASSPDLERIFGELVQSLDVDLVHFQTLEGLSAGCVATAKQAGARAVFSLHNYHTICPQVYLMKRDSSACTDFENGHACVGCHDPAWKRKSERPGRSVTKRVRSAGDFLMPLPVLGSDARGETARLAQDSDGPASRVVVSNEALADPVSSLAPNEYGLRRMAMIRALNKCDRVHAVSEFVASKFEALGVERSRLATRTLGTSMVELAKQQTEVVRTPAPLSEGPRPIRVVFLGYHNRAKGLDLLLEALERSEPGVLARLHLCIHALGVGPIANRIRRLEAHLARLTLSDGYDREDIPWLLGAADLGVVPSIWWDNGPQTVMEMLACGVPVLGAELGGIPDFVAHGQNGLLFEGNNLEDLVSKLRQVVQEDGLLDRLRSGVQISKSIESHVDEILAIYEDCVDGNRQDRSQARRAV